MAGDAGLEPTHVAVKVLCLTDLANPLYKVVSAQGFEPRTHALEGRCSIQLSYAPIYWSGKRDSNSRLQPWQGCALPLNYSRIYFNGGTNRARTCDPLLVRQVLSQLSYGPGIIKMERVKGIEPSQPAWKAGTLPLSYTRISFRVSTLKTAYHLRFIILILVKSSTY